MKKRMFCNSSARTRELSENPRFFIAGDIPEPTEDDLKTYFETNIDRFTSPPSFDLDHVMFNADSTPPPDLIEQLNAGADPARFGDGDLTFGRVMRFMTQTRMVQSLGPDAAREALAALDGNERWQGPFVAPTGSQHFLRVVTRNAPTVPEFNRARDWIATQWLADKSREMLDEELRKVAAEYRIEIIPQVEADGDV